MGSLAKPAIEDYDEKRAREYAHKVRSMRLASLQGVLINVIVNACLNNSVPSGEILAQIDAHYEHE